jgi:hypothetical protein
MASKISAITDVLEFSVQDYKTKDLLFTVDYASSVSFKSSNERLDIRGGMANPILLTTDHTKTFEMNSELPLVDIDLLAHKLGTGLVTGATVATKTERVIVSATNTATFSQIPEATSLKLYTLEDNGNVAGELVAGDPDLNADEYELIGDDVTVNVAVVEGTTLLAIYEYTTGVTAREISVTAKDFPDFIIVSGRGYMIDKYDGSKVLVSFKIYKGKVDPAFEITAKSGENTSLAFNVMAYAEDVRQSNGCIIKKFANIVQLPDEVTICD